MDAALQKKLNEAVETRRAALALHPEGHPERSSSLCDLSFSLYERSKQTGQMEDLNESIEHDRAALLLRPDGHPNRSNSLNNLATSLRTRCERMGQVEDLDEAIKCHRAALALRPEGHPDRSNSFNNLAPALRTRFDWMGRMEDLDEAIKCHRAALSLRPDGHPSRSNSLNNLAVCLRTRFEQMCQMEDLDEAIRCHRAALSLRPEGHISRSNSFNNLATSLRTRFDRMGQIEDLGEAIKFHRAALSLRPDRHSHRSNSLNNLAVCLRTRFEQMGHTRMEDLDEAIKCNRAALALRPEGHPDRSNSFNNLATSLRTRFEQMSEVEDLDEAIKCHRAAIALCPKEHSDRSNSLIGLSKSLQIRFDRTNCAAELSEKAKALQDIIEHLSEAEALLPHLHPMHIQLKSRSAAARLKQYDLDPSQTSLLDKAFGLFESSVQHHSGSLRHRFEASIDWIGAARRLQHASTLRAYSASLALLHRMSVQNSTLESQHRSLLSNYYKIPKSLACDAASNAIEIGRIRTAVEMLEKGRAIMWSRMKAYRDSLLQLHVSHPQLALRFEALSSQLEQYATASTSDSCKSTCRSAIPSETQQRDYRRLSERWNKVVEKIRKVDGYQNFLKAVRFPTLRKAATGGPVILINVSEYRSDAIIVFETSDPIIVPLPKISPSDVDILITRFLQARASDPEGFSNKLRAILRDLWEMVVHPVVEQLQKFGVEPKSRIWWCPTSKLCTLPIHAAGPYSARTNNLPDLYVSSYTPTLSALISAQENISHAPMVPRLLVVGEPDGGAIPAVEEEVRRIQNLGPFVETLSGEAANYDNVVLKLQTSSWSHFACHGKLNPIPFRSSFKLHQGQRLEILDIIKARLPNAELVFLSACHAAAVDIEGMPDEVIHLSAALQFCGFRSVVGTLWAMADEDGPDVAQDFYRHMFRDLQLGKVDFRDAATALNLATREMRKKRIPLSRWVNFVHIGA